ncbi:MAG: site-specific integrase [Chloracidobacterium sp.]|nr:site-specific integrase [Chloracidobacterium sp.]
MKRDLVREYLSYCRVEKGLAANSIASYENDLSRLSEWADKNGHDLLHLDRRDLREWLIDLGAVKLSENSKRRRMISAVRGFYKFLMFEDTSRKILPKTWLHLKRDSICRDFLIKTR